MLLAIAATQFEMHQFQTRCRLPQTSVRTCISGVGLLESALSTTRILEKYHTELSCVVNFGIGGAYIQDKSEQAAGLLDICLASREVLGDYGVCMGAEVEPFTDPQISGSAEFDLRGDLFRFARQSLAQHYPGFCSGTFVTVNGASGTGARGLFLRNRYGAICENMEGGAIARVCQEFGLPLVEVRAISNMVEDRPGSPWKLHEACDMAARAASLIIDDLQENP